MKYCLFPNSGGKQKLLYSNDSTEPRTPDEAHLEFWEYIQELYLEIYFKTKGCCDMKDYLDSQLSIASQRVEKLEKELIFKNEVISKQTYSIEKLLEALRVNSRPKHTEPPHNHPTQTPPQESEHPQTHEG